MPFAAAYISVMASGGIAPYTSFKRLSEVDLMPAMQGEAREIIKDVEIFGIDPLTAIENAAKKESAGHFQETFSQATLQQSSSAETSVTFLKEKLKTYSKQEHCASKQRQNDLACFWKPSS